MCDHLTTIGFQYEGVFAPYVEIPKQAIIMENVIKLPDNISYDNASLIEPAACALNGQSYMHIEPGDHVVIYGSGIIGCIHAELAFLKGAAKVMIVEPVEKRGKIAIEKVPGVIWINPFTQNTVEEVMKETDNYGSRCCNYSNFRTFCTYRGTDYRCEDGKNFFVWRASRRRQRTS